MEAQDLFQQVNHFEEAYTDPYPGSQLQKIKELVPGFKEWFKGTGKVTAFYSFDLVTVPWKIEHGLWRAKRRVTCQ